MENQFPLTQEKIAFCLDALKQMQAGSMDFYALLGLERSATQAQITNAHDHWSRILSSSNLEQIGNNDVRTRMGLFRDTMNRGYAVLSDYEKRAAYEKRGFKEESQLEPQEEDPQEEARQFLRKARTLYAQKKYGTAMVALERAVKLGGERAEYLLLLGLCQSRSPALIRDAEANLQKAAQQESWNAEPLVALGNLFYSERLFKRAESFYRRALSLEPGHEMARRRLKEIAPDTDASLKSSLKSALKKGLPSLFNRKK